MSSKKINNESVNDLFFELNKSLNKTFDGGDIASNFNYSIDEWIDTGNYILNAQISGSLFGGIPNNRSVLIAGDQGTGKTYLTLNICREAQKMGYNIIYCDSEAAVDKDVFLRMGLDLNKIRHQLVSTVQDFSSFATNLVDSLKKLIESGKTPPKILLVLDSLGNLASSKEKKDILEGKDVRDMTKQQLLRSLFRTLTVDLSKLKIPFIITNHTYQGIGMFASKEISGGGGALFNASIVLMLSKSKLVDDKEKKDDDLQSTGIVVTSNVKKNRFARPITVRFHISFFKGMNRYTGLEKYISYDTCGICRGKLYTESEYSKLKSSDISGKTVHEFIKDDKKYYIVENKNARSFVDKNKLIDFEPSKLFTKEILDDNVLKQLDDNIIKKTFMLPDIDEINASDYSTSFNDNDVDAFFNNV